MTTQQQEIEVILARHLAEYLAMPMFIVDPEGNLVFYNEPAESILGMRYRETGPMNARDLATIFQPLDERNQPIEPQQLPLMIATMKRHPAHRRLLIRGRDQKLRQIEVTAFPLISQGNRFLGALSVFWEVTE